MMRYAVVLIVSACCFANVGHAAKRARKPAPARSQRRHRTAKAELPKSDGQVLAEKLARCKDDDPLCGTSM